MDFEPLSPEVEVSAGSLTFELEFALMPPSCSRSPLLPLRTFLNSV